jgi:maltokinase
VNVIAPEVLEDYLVRTRWFAGKSRPFRVSQVRRIADLDGSDRGVRVAVFLVTVDYSDGEGGNETYQVPLSLYDEPQEAIAHAFIGAADEEGRITHVYDAVHDRYAMALWIGGLVAAEESGVVERGGLRFHRVPGTEPLDPRLRASPLSGEQSNSSIRFDDIAIMKVFRKVTPGVNPDIEIHRELTREHSEHVAALYGWVETDVDGETVQLAMVQEFLRTASDGFELAIGSVRSLLSDPSQSVEESGADFAGEAARLGTAVAEVHAALRARFPSETRDAAAARSLARALEERLDHALGVVPELAPFAERLRATYGAVAALGSLAVQRVHGDLHLGQTLRTAHGWRIVDFEGEPGRPFADRSLPDSPWRDVAGMLRSFDYVPGTVALTQTTDEASDPEGEGDLRVERAREWARRARGHFLDAYVGALCRRESVGADAAAPGEEERILADNRTLLDAYVADKAVYEAVYEKRNRPAWIAIPLAALADVV